MSYLPIDGNRHPIPVPAYTTGTTVQTVTVSGTAANSSALGTGDGRERIVRLVSTTACHVLPSSAGTSATTSHMLLPANVPMDLAIPNGWIISVIQNSAGGTLYITDFG